MIAGQDSNDSKALKNLQCMVFNMLSGIHFPREWEKEKMAD